MNLTSIANQVSEQQAKNQAYFEQVLKGREELDKAVLFYKREVEMLHDRAEKSTDLDRILDAAVIEHAATRSIIEIEEMFEFPVRRGYEYDRRIRELIGNLTEDSLSVDFDSTHSSTGDYAIEHLTEDYSEVASIESNSQSRIDYHRANIIKEMSSVSAEEEKKEEASSNLIQNPAGEANTLFKDEKDVKVSGETIFEREETITMDMLYGLSLMVNRDLNPEISLIQSNPKQLLLVGSDCSAIPDSIPVEVDKSISIPARSLNGYCPVSPPLEKDAPTFNCDTAMMEEIASVLVAELLRDGASFALSIQTKKQAIVEKLQPKKLLKVPGPPKAPKMPFNARVDAELVKLFVNLGKNFVPVTPIPADYNDAELLAINLTNEAIAEIQRAHQSRFRRLKIPGEPRPLNTSDLLSKATELIQNWRNYTERNGRNFEPKLELEVRTKGREICNTDLVDQICQDYVIDKILKVLFADCATVIQKVGRKHDFTK